MEAEERGNARWKTLRKKLKTLLKSLSPVGNISKQSGTKSPRTCLLQNMSKGGSFQSRPTDCELLPHLEQQSRCQNIEWFKLALLPSQLKSRAVCAVSQWLPSLSQLLSIPASQKSTNYTSSDIGLYTQTKFSVPI